MIVNIKCDRCGNVVEGMKETTSDGLSFTGGYYEIEPGGYWYQFSNESEKKVCDGCMHSDPRYQKVYGKPN